MARCDLLGRYEGLTFDNLIFWNAFVHVHLPCSRSPGNLRPLRLGANLCVWLDLTTYVDGFGPLEAPIPRCPLGSIALSADPVLCLMLRLPSPFLLLDRVKLQFCARCLRFSLERRAR